MSTRSHHNSCGHLCISVHKNSPILYTKIRLLCPREVCHPSDLSKLLRMSVKAVHKCYLSMYWLYRIQRSLIILVGLTMTLFSEKMLISTRCVCGFMPNLYKKSWMVSNLGDGDGGGKSAGGGGKSKSGGDDGFIPNDLSSDPCWTLLTWNMKYCFA